LYDSLLQCALWYTIHTNECFAVQRIRDSASESESLLCIVTCSFSLLFRKFVSLLGLARNR
jgi:hypothetical protein